jgi:hypothetical protein
MAVLEWGETNRKHGFDKYTYQMPLLPACFLITGFGVCIQNFQKSACSTRNKCSWPFFDGVFGVEKTGWCGFAPA